MAGLLTYLVEQVCIICSVVTSTEDKITLTGRAYLKCARNLTGYLLNLKVLWTSNIAKCKNGQSSLALFFLYEVIKSEALYS